MRVVSPPSLWQNEPESTDGSPSEATMAKVLMLWPANADLRIGSGQASELAALGVTSLVLLRDAESVGVVLDGWAFDPARSARAAAAVLGASQLCRTLLSVLEIGVTNVTAIGGTDDSTLAAAGGDVGGTHPVGG